MRVFTHDDPGTSRQDWEDLVADAVLPPLDLTTYQRVDVVGAHPADESVGAAGLVPT